MNKQTDWNTEAKLLWEVLQELKKINASLHSTIMTVVVTTTTTTTVI